MTDQLAHYPESLATRGLQKFMQPNVIMISAMVIMTGLGWVFLVIMLSGFASEVSLSQAGPGMTALQQYFTTDGEISFARALYLSICGPIGQATLLNAKTSALSAIVFYLPMWFAMMFAMMLPASSPLMLAYMDIAQAARRKQIATVQPWILLAGFLAVWFMFSLTAASLQWLSTSFALMGEGLVLTHPITMASILAAAGTYQLSPLKQACMVKCRSPMPFLMARWSEKTIAVFKMGVEHGLACLGCCWALMLVMFAAGLMNLIWMGILTLLMLLEKTIPNPKWLTRISGLALLAWSVTIISRIVLQLS